MSLNWNLGDIENYKEVCWVENKDPDPRFEDPNQEKKLGQITNGLIWATIHIGIRKITKDNVDDFHERLRIFEKIVGHLTYKIVDGVSVSAITYEDIKKHIGLGTNADIFSRKQFEKRMKDRLWEYTSNLVLTKAEKERSPKEEDESSEG